jgi:preprotein translocase subunit SecD
VLDGVVKSAPEIQPDQAAFSPFQADQISISGNFKEKEARDLALVLRYGALPVQLQPQAVQTVSATLGKDSLRAGVIAGLIGVALVIVFMFVYYRALGLVVLGGVLLSAAILWAAISYLGETQGLALTLAGATGIIVSVGVTVDSYVVYFERLKDDVRLGRTLRSSTTRSWKSAWRTILAADIVSLIGAALLWYLTVGSVRGFAFFLGLSTLIDIVVAYFFTRPAVTILARSRFIKSDHVLGVTTGEGSSPVPAGASR